jgi:hypothetical protein
MTRPRQVEAAPAETPASTMDVDQVAQALGMSSPNDERRLIYA